MLQRALGACAAIALIALIAAAVAFFPASAGARMAGKRVAVAGDGLCAVLLGDQGVGIDFEGLGPAEARHAAGLLTKSAKTGVPAKLKKDLKKLAKVYRRIAAGNAASEVVADAQSFLNSALTRLSKYVQANCAPG